MPTFLVNNNNDSGSGSLRDAIIAANLNPDADVIEFDSLLSGNIITLTSGQLSINNPLTIDGPSGGGLLSISGNNASRIFDIYSAGEVKLNDLIITGGQADFGGAIFNEDTDLSITGSTISGNTATVDGGAIFNYEGTLDIFKSTIANNTAGENAGAINNEAGAVGIISSTISGNRAINDDGGAIDNDDGVVQVFNSTISGNTAGDDGGAIESTYSDNSNQGLLIINSTISNNTSTDKGGGIDNESGFFGIINSTISGNTGGTGGGIYNGGYGYANLFNVTIADNSATFSGGGIYNALDGEQGLLNINNTIIANSVNGGDCVNNGDITNNVNNLIGDGSCDPLLSGDPDLGPLQDNGGATLTRALLPGSKAIDAGDNAAFPFAINEDQRGAGFARIVDGTIDIGAFEVQSQSVPEPSALMGLVVLTVAGVSSWWRRRR